MRSKLYSSPFRVPLLFFSSIFCTRINLTLSFSFWGIHKLPITSTKRKLLNKSTEDYSTKHGTTNFIKTEDDSGLEVLRFDRNFPASNSATPL